MNRDEALGRLDWLRMNVLMVAKRGNPEDPIGLCAAEHARFSDAVIALRAALDLLAKMEGEHDGKP